MEEGSDVVKTLGPSKEEGTISRIGDDIYVDTMWKSYDQMHTNNILCVRFNPEGNRILTTSSDRTLKIWNWETGEVAIQYEAGVVISCDWHPNNPNRVVFGTLDCRVLVLDFDYSSGKTVEVFQSKADHTSHVLRVKWHPTGAYFMSCSSDHTVLLFKPLESTYERIRTFVLDNAVEAIEFNNEGTGLVVAAREADSLYWIDHKQTEVLSRPLSTETMLQETRSTEATFSILDLKFSKSGNYLLAATDGERVIAYVRDSAVIARNFYGMQNDKSSQPKVCWNTTDKYIYVTSALDNAVYVYDVCCEKNVTQLKGHTALVRDIARHPTKEILATCSYDKSVKIWTQSESKTSQGITDTVETQ